MHPRFLRLALSLSLAVTACRGQETPPAASGELIGPVVEGQTDVKPPAPAAPPARPGAPAPVVESWNTAQIDWQPYEAGLARAKAQKKPICLVLYTGWCPHCRNYSHVFDDPKVVE